MDGKYNLNDLAMMTGFTTRTLRNYLNQDILNGEKVNGVWQFTDEQVDSFFKDPFVKEGVRIKRNGVVFDFLADRKKKAERACVILDIPSSWSKGNAVSAFFCEKMQEASDTVFCFDWDNGAARVILSGAADQVAEIMKAYGAMSFDE